MKRSFLWDDPPICTLGVAVSVNYKKQASGGSRIFLHENERIWIEGGTVHVPGALLGFGNAIGGKLGANDGYC